jgi:hypothetical protein
VGPHQPRQAEPVPRVVPFRLNRRVFRRLHRRRRAR